jgi:hypothetical protein
VDEAELNAFIGGLPGVAVQTAGPGDGSPEVAWGDSFFFYDPDDAGPEARRFPFATIVTKDYPGFDTASRLDRPGLFRLNLPLGRDRFRRLFGFAPAELEDHRAEFAFDAPDRLVPHPVYGRQGWVSVVVPGPSTDEQVRELIAHAYEQARGRHARRASGSEVTPEEAW